MTARRLRAVPAVAALLMLSIPAGAFTGLVFPERSTTETSSTPRVEIIVNPSLHADGGIDAGLGRYVQDLRVQGYDPIVTAEAFTTATDLRNHLARGYYSESGLSGAVIVGDLPVQNYRMEDQYAGWPGVDHSETFATDLYLQDLNGTWSDTDYDGLLDSHTGATAPEIFVGRIQTSNLTGLQPGRSEAGLINDYFDRNHAYRTGELRVPGNGLSYVDENWAGYDQAWTDALGRSVAGEVTGVCDESESTAWDLGSRLATTPYESVFVAAHAAETYMEFDSGAGGRLESVDLANVDPQALFYNLYACTAGDLTHEGNLLGEFVFGDGLGLLGVGSSKIGGMPPEAADAYYGNLTDGLTFGEAWLAWWQGLAADGFQPGEAEREYGMMLAGDPLLAPQAYMIPEPLTLLLLGIGAVGLRRRR